MTLNMAPLYTFVEDELLRQRSVNSYLGIMKHYRSYKLRKDMLFKHLSGWWWNYVCLSGRFVKLTLKKNKAAQHAIVNVSFSDLV